MFYNVMYTRLETDMAYILRKVCNCKERKENSQNIVKFYPVNQSFLHSGLISSINCLIVSFDKCSEPLPTIKYPTTTEEKKLTLQYDSIKFGNQNFLYDPPKDKEELLG